MSAETLGPDADEDRLAAACLENAGSIGELAIGYGATVAERDARLHRHRSPVEGGLWNAVTWTRLSPDDADDVIGATLDWYGGSCRWWVGPGATPDDLDERLVAAGFEAEEVPGMVCDLGADWDAPDPAGLRVVRADDRASIDDAMKVFVALSGEGTWADGWASAFAWFLDRDDRPIQVFVGYEDGEPVTCGWLARGAGVAGIYGVQTLEERRGRGLGAALTRAPMRAARHAGDRVAVLQAAPLAVPLYERIGFRQVCRIGLYER